MNIFRKHLISYTYAFRGIWIAFRYERNMLFHLLAAVVVITLNITLHVTKTDWLLTIILIGLAWTTEIFNTAIEKLADHVSPNRHPLIGSVKDLAAGAVLVICLTAAVCGVIIYWGYVY